MSSLEKMLKKFNKDEREALILIIERIFKQDFTGLDIKKLKGYPHVLRVRRGKMRIVFTTILEIRILIIERRNDHTYAAL